MQQSTPKVVLDRITDVETTESGAHYFAAYFKAGLFGRPVRRAFFGKTADDGSVNWERVSPDDLRPMVGQDFTGQVFVEPIDVEPVEYVSKQTGEVKTITSASICRLADETTESACRIYRYEVRKASAEVVPLVPPGFHVVAGDGASV